jgi:hypothetical protein
MYRLPALQTMRSIQRGMVMKHAITMVIILGAMGSCFFTRVRLIAQQCQDEEAMVVDYTKSLTEMVETVRKEGLPEFEKSYHQKACLTKLTLCLGMLDELVGCLEKASVDSTATKDQMEAYKAKRDAYTKLKDKVEGDRKALKASEDSKAAKTLIEKFDFSN